MKMNARLIAVMMVVQVVLMGGGINGEQMVCSVGVSDLMKCKPAVTPPNPKEPTAECCAVVAKADLKCLCSYKNSPLLPSLGIDPDLAVKLPAKCNVPNPPTC